MKTTKPKAVTEVDREIGSRLRARREQLGLSQADVAAILGSTYQQLHKYEVGENRVAAAMLLRLAEVLEIDAVKLLPVKGRPARDKTARSRAPRDQLAEQLLVAFARISSVRERRLVLDLARQLAGNSRQPKGSSSDG